MADSEQNPVEDQYDHSESEFNPALDLPIEGVSPPVAKPASGQANTPAPASGPPKTPRKHLPGLVRRALAHGASKDEIEQATPGDLDAWVEEQDVIRDRAREQNRHQSDSGHAMDAQRRVRTPQEPTEPDDESELDAVAQEYGLDAKFVNIIKRQAKELKELKGQVKQHGERSQSREQQERNAAYDMAFEQLGKKFEKVVGKGDGDELRGTKELARRNAIIKSANVLETDTGTVIRRKLAKATEALYGDVVSAPAEEDAGPYGGETEVRQLKPTNGRSRITPEQWNNGTLAKPTQRTVKEKKGRDVAIRKVQEQMTENPDVYGNEFESFEEDGLPE